MNVINGRAGDGLLNRLDQPRPYGAQSGMVHIVESHHRNSSRARRCVPTNLKALRTLVKRILAPSAVPIGTEQTELGFGRGLRKLATNQSPGWACRRPNSPFEAENGNAPRGRVRKAYA